MEWTTVQHLDLKHTGRGVNKPLQPHAAVFHPTQALIAVAIGTYIVEFDVFTGSKLSSVDISSPVVRMSYSPTGGHSVIAIIEDCTIRSCDFDIEQSCVLHSPEKQVEQISVDTEVHLALTPLLPVVFFGFHRRMSVAVVGTVEGGRSPTKIKTDLKKPIVNLACHPRLPVLYVAYADGLIRAYNIQTYAVHYTLQFDNTIRLNGAGAFAFHPVLEWIFVGDRRGTLLAWDVSTERPSMIGIIQVGSQPITSISWLSTSRLLLSISKDGMVHVWKTRVTLNPSRPPMQATFFESAGIEPIDIPHILSKHGGEPIYTLPRIRALEVHPKLNVAALLFANMTGGDNLKNKEAYARAGRKQLFAIIQTAKGSSASVLKEKLSSLGSSGILADYQLQAQLQENYLKGHCQLTISDVARKALLISHFIEGHAKSLPISRLPLITLSECNHQLKEFPVCQPSHLELNFFNKENRVLHYPVRIFYIDGTNLMAYNLCSGVDNIFKKLHSLVSGNVEYHAKHLAYSGKQHLFIMVYELKGLTNEVVFYWENAGCQPSINRENVVKGIDVAFVGPNDDQLAILGEDKIGLSLYSFLGGASESNEKALFNEENQSSETIVASLRKPLQFIFESEVERIFTTPLEYTLLFASNGSHIGLTKLAHGDSQTSSGSLYISTKMEKKSSIKLNVNEIVLQVQWQGTLKGCVAGVLTTQRVLIISENLDILAQSSTNFDKGFPSFRSLLWVGPALLFSTATTVSMLGWDGITRIVLSISMPHAVLVGALNDRLLLANPTDINPQQKKRVEIRSCLVGLLEPLLIGFATMQKTFDQKTNMLEILYQITSRFDSLRITPRSLDILTSCPPTCGDLAVSLSQAGPQFTQVMRSMYAVKALCFSTALSVLKDELLRCRDYPHCSRTSYLFHLFQQLGHACVKYGQFDSAKEVFEVIADYESMLDLFICHLNPSAMRHLSQKLEEESMDPELRRYFERILRIRSAGWTQGIFSNFAAENMVPKGPRWGGGNWEIKTPVNMNNMPGWELAAEVMSYMKTDDGTIPAIIANHIGVFLGSRKGKGNAVEVREESQVKSFFIPAGETSASDHPKHMAEGIPNDNLKDNSLTGMEILTVKNASLVVADEQVKAAEEFKKTCSIVGDAGSSDDEGISRTKRLQIRIREKQLSSSTVDIDKIKEATRQLKLNEGLGPLTRTKSFTSSQNTAPVLSSLPSPVVPSGRVAGMPIPEDFFQNTIPSIQAASSLPARGADPAELDQTSLRLYGGEEATGAIQAGGGNHDAAQASPLESVDLPCEDASPQASAQASILNQSEVPGSLAFSMQPLDLSVLGVGDSTYSQKPVGPIVSSLACVQPGQVPRGAAASECFKTGITHLEQNQLSDALSCLDEAFLALARDLSRGVDVKAQTTISAQYKIAVKLLQEISRLHKVQGPNAISAKDEIARLSRHLASLALLAKHRMNCIRTAIKRNMEVQNYGYAKQMLELLLSKAPTSKQDELKSLIDMCVGRGSANRSMDVPEADPSLFCATTLSRLSTIGYDVCDLCGAKFSALSAPGCVVCGMGSIKRLDVLSEPLSSPFG